MDLYGFDEMIMENYRNTAMKLFYILAEMNTQINVSKCGYCALPVKVILPLLYQTIFSPLFWANFFLWEFDVTVEFCYLMGSPVSYRSICQPKM